jgi:hypothetical protein
MSQEYFLVLRGEYADSQGIDNVFDTAWLLGQVQHKGFVSHVCCRILRYSDSKDYFADSIKYSDGILVGGLEEYKRLISSRDYNATLSSINKFTKGPAVDLS